MFDYSLAMTWRSVVQDAIRGQWLALLPLQDPPETSAKNDE